MIFALLLIPVAFVAVVTLLSYTLYCYEEANQSGRPLSPFLAMTARTVLHSVVSELLIVVLHPLGLWPGLWTKPASGGPIVFLVHGLFHNQGAWILFRRRLHARGLTTACHGYASWGTDWNSTVDTLEKHLTELLRENPERDIHLIGHSMGGLLLRSVLWSPWAPPSGAANCGPSPSRPWADTWPTAARRSEKSPPCPLRDTSAPWH